LQLLVILFVIPQRSEGCRCPFFRLSFRSEAKLPLPVLSFVIPQRSEVAVARSFVCHSAAKRRNLRLQLFCPI
jgi:hypothetical protein